MGRAGSRCFSRSTLRVAAVFGLHLHPGLQRPGDQGLLDIIMALAPRVKVEGGGHHNITSRGTGGPGGRITCGPPMR